MKGLYLKVFGIGLQDTFVYRWNFVLRSVFSVIPLFATVLVWKSVSEANGQIQDYSFSAMVFYFVGILIVENLASPTEDEWRIAAEIREGQISSLLIKPLNYLGYRLSLFLSYRLLYTLITFPILGAVLWFLREHLQWPTHMTTWPLFALAVAGSALIQFFIAYSMAMFAFWILEVSTLIFILYSFEYFFSGHVFPLDLLPPGVQSLLQWTPFPYELFFPVQILLERLPQQLLLKGFAIQGLWVCITAAFAHMLWSRGVRHYQAAGG
jgi:ABC-2 type transport system permease protein